MMRSINSRFDVMTRCWPSVLETNRPTSVSPGSMGRDGPSSPPLETGAMGTGADAGTGGTGRPTGGWGAWTGAS
jgi:hypothetical protein